MDCLRSLEPLDGAVNPNVLDTFPGVAPGARSRNRGIATPRAVAPDRPKVPLGDLAIQTVAVALAAGMLAGKRQSCAVGYSYSLTAESRLRRFQHAQLEVL